MLALLDSAMLLVSATRWWLRSSAEQLFSIPVVTAGRVELMIGVTRPTAQAAIDALVDRGDLTEVTGRARGRVYEARHDAVYGPADVEDPLSHRSSAEVG